jgi:hypothetical protein
MEPLPAAPAAPTRQPTNATDLVEVAHILVLLQGAILVARTIEAAFFLAFAGAASVVSLGVTASAAVLTLATAAALSRGSRRARRWTLIAESGVIVVGVVDLLLALAMTSEPLGPVELIVGLAIPAAVIVLLRRR